jgi:hypothetical protein
MAILVGQCDVTDLAAPTFHQRNGNLIASQCSYVRSNWSGRQTLELIPNECHGVLYF